MSVRSTAPASVHRRECSSTRGVATSFSLDFETALAVPVALALFASEDRDELLTSPLALLEGLERTAERLVVFCEAGRIQAQPSPQSRLCTLLERLIVEVAARHEQGSFHPKLWVLRYRPLGKGEPVRMRLLVLSRNLTRDRSWDISLCLDGQVGRVRVPVNRPLVELLGRLTSLATGTPPAHAGELIVELSRDLHRTRWILPVPFDKVSFAVNGTSRSTWNLPACKRLGVVSPFCDDDTLKLLADLAEEPLRLVGRSEELSTVAPEVIDLFSEVFVMDELAETEDGESGESEEEEVRPLSGLHAKVFVQENGWDTAITVGSGNATRPALITGKNVEVFATLTGKRSKVGGIADIFGPENFGRVLRRFESAEISESDTGLREAEQRVEKARRELANAGLVLRCTEGKDTREGQKHWRMVLLPDRSVRLDGLGTATSWPITRGEVHARDVLSALRKGVPIEIGTLSLADVTRFVAFRLTDEFRGEVKALFSLGLKIDGAPANRYHAVMRSILDSKEAFLRYLRLLLADVGDPLSTQFAASAVAGGAGWRPMGDDEPILEDMVRALSHGSDRLRAVRRLMERLEQLPDDNSEPVVPEDFLELWNAFREVLNERGRRGA